MEYNKTGLTQKEIELFDRLPENLLKIALYSRSLPRNDIYSVYRIVNNINGRSYIGQSCRVKQRIVQHFGDLKRHKHASRKLQADYDLYGVSAFTAEVLDGCLYDDEISHYESAWIIYYNAAISGYNTNYSWNAAVKECLEDITGLVKEATRFPEEFPREIIPIRI